MRTLEKIRADLQDRNIQVVAKNTGLHPNSIYNILHNKAQPKYETVRKLEEYLNKE